MLLNPDAHLRAVYNTCSCLFLTEIQVSLVNSGRHRGLWHSTWGYWQTAVYSAAENLSRTDAFALTPLPCSDRARCARCAHTGRCAPHILLISAALSRLFQSKTCPVTVLNKSSAYWVYVLYCEEGDTELCIFCKREFIYIQSDNDTSSVISQEDCSSLSSRAGANSCIQSPEQHCCIFTLNHLRAMNRTHLLLWIMIHTKSNYFIRLDLYVMHYLGDLILSYTHHLGNLILSYIELILLSNFESTLILLIIIATW